MKQALFGTKTKWTQGIFSLFSLAFLFGAFFVASPTANAATWKVYSNLLTKSCGTESPSGSGNWTPTSNVSCPTDGSTCSTVGQQVGCGTCSCVYSIPRCMLGSTATCEDSGGSSGGGSLCGSAAKSYPYGSTAYSGSLCVSGSSPTVGNGNVPFPAPGKTVTWTCFNRSSPSSNCSASQAAAPITCGSANGGTFPASGPSSNLCSDGSKPIVSYRLSGGYKIGFSWTCGTNSCSANLSPGVCGSANGTTRITAPSTAAELCQAGLSSSVSGSGPWLWSCTGTSCSANKTASSCTPSCPNSSSYCTTDYLGSDGCGGSCGYGSVSCSKFKVCPDSIMLNPLETYNLTAKYWSSWSSTSLPTCTSGLSVDKTLSATWSRSSGLATTAVVGNGDANGAKGLVTAGSPLVNSSITVKATYGGRLSTATVGVHAAGGGGSTFSCQPNSSITLTNASLCSGDASDLLSNVQNTLVDSCSTPLGSGPKCEYVCKPGYTKSGTTCVASSSCFCVSGENAERCIGTTYVNSCGSLCNGSKQCDGHFTEIAP